MVTRAESLAHRARASGSATVAQQAAEAEKTERQEEQRKAEEAVKEHSKDVGGQLQAGFEGKTVLKTKDVGISGQIKEGTVRRTGGEGVKQLLFQEQMRVAPTAPTGQVITAITPPPLPSRGWGVGEGLMVVEPYAVPGGFRAKEVGREKVFEYTPPKTKFQEFETGVSKTLKLKPLPTWEEEKKKSSTFLDVVKKYAPKKWKAPIEKGERFGYEFTRKYWGNIVEKPVSVGIPTAAWFIVPGALGGVGKIAKLMGLGKVTKAFPLTTKAVRVGVSVGLPAVYGASVITRVEKQPDYITGARKLGDIAALEVTPMLVGGYAGAKFWPYIIPKITGRWRTRGKKYIPPEKIIEPKVFREEQMFPVAPPSKHLKLFTESKYQLPKSKFIDAKTKGVWHAMGTGKPSTFEDIVKAPKGTMAKILEQPRGHLEYLPGGFVSPSLSPYFLRVRGQSYLYDFTSPIFPSIGLPTAVFTYPKGFKKMSGTSEQMSEFLIKRAKRGYAYVHPERKAKWEVEALLPPETKVEKLKGRFYTVWGGVRIPIQEVKAITTKSEKVKIFKLGELTEGYKPSAIITKPGLSVTSYKSITSSLNKYSSSISKELYYKPYEEYKPAPYRPKPYAPPKYKPAPYKPPTYKVPPYKPPAYKVPPYEPPKYKVPPYKPPAYKVPPYYPPPYKRPPPPPPPPFILPKLKKGLVKPKKKKKKIKRETRYQPSLSAIYPERKYGKKPKLLTGISIRPLLNYGKPRRKKRKR